MKIDTLSDLIDFKHQLEYMGKGIPENLIIVSPEIIEEALEWVGRDVNIIKQHSGVKIYGINVIRDYAEIVEQ